MLANSVPSQAIACRTQPNRAEWIRNAEQVIKAASELAVKRGAGWLNQERM